MRARNIANNLARTISAFLPTTQMVIRDTRKHTKIVRAKHSSMKKSCATIAVLAVSFQSANAQEATSAVPPLQLELCSVPPTQFKSDGLMPPDNVKVQANEARITQNKVATFTGNVDITSDAARIQAQRAEVKNDGKDVKAEGSVSYQDQNMLVNSDSVILDSESESFVMDNTQYQLTGFVGHGAADNIEVSKSDGIVLNDVSFTTCPMGQEDWQLRASEISIDNDARLGEAKNTRFYVGGVPVFYLPYFAFPVSNERQSGLLFPKISSSSPTGVDYEQPYYWNIAPNYDMTIAPRLMSNRGTQLKTEFRYLTESQYGQFNIEYLPSDDELSQDSTRYFYRWYHKGNLNDNWQISADVNGLSDDNYIVDLGSDFYNRADTHLFRTFGLNYYSQDLDFSVFFRDFEIIGDHPDTYRALPEAQLTWTQDLTNFAQFRIDSELAYFDNEANDRPTALRFHVAPTLTVPYIRPWGEVTAEATLYNTYYRQDNVEGTTLEEEVNRTIAQGRIFGNLRFERDYQWLGQDATMTLEPTAQYLYTSFEDQSNIGLYDATALLIDYDGLFRGREFTGLDRFSDNNQITLGVTSRIIDANNREQLVASIGQIFYLEDSKIFQDTRTDDRSALAAELDWRISDTWFVHTDIQITTETDKVERSSFALEYRQDESRLVQFSHRFVRNLSGETIDQLGISASWPIAKNWQWVGRNFRDLERDRSIETYFGLQYDSCCWAVRFIAQRNLTNRFDATGLQSVNEYDSGVSLQFIFKGISSSNSQRSMLRDGMFGYRRPYVLN